MFAQNRQSPKKNKDSLLRVFNLLREQVLPDPRGQPAEDLPGLRRGRQRRDLNKRVAGHLGQQQVAMRVGVDVVGALSQRQLRGQAVLLAVLPHDPRPQPPKRCPRHQRPRSCALPLLIVYNNLNGGAFPAHHAGRHPLRIPQPAQLQGHC